MSGIAPICSRAPSTPGNRFSQFGLPDRFQEVRGDSQFLAAHCISPMARGSKHHDGSRGGVWALPDSFTQFETVHPGHVHVHQDQCEGLSCFLRFVQFCQSLFSVLRRTRNHFPAPQHSFQDSPVRAVVVHQEDLHSPQYLRRSDRPDFDYFRIRNPDPGGEVELAPSSEFAFHPDSPSHHLYQPARNPARSQGARKPPH